MEKREAKTPGVPRFANEQEEARWWASAAGRRFLKQQSASGEAATQRGSKLVRKLARGSSVQIALRLASPDLAKAREIAERKGIGYQTLLKMIVHEGLLRAERQVG
jgi:predicted DNA binding CopG/RHH family protein